MGEVEIICGVEVKRVLEARWKWPLAGMPVRILQMGNYVHEMGNYLDAPRHLTLTINPQVLTIKKRF